MSAASISSHGGVQPRIAQYRIVSDIALRWTAWVGAGLCVLQVAFAASGFWGVVENPGNQAAGIAAFGMHTMTGQILKGLAIIMLILGAVARPNRKAWIIPLVLALLLLGVQGALLGLAFGISGLFGALHALMGMAIAGGFLWVAIDRGRHPLGSKDAAGSYL